MDSEINIPTNKFQTSITKELLDSLPGEIASQLVDYINNVPYIRYLTSTNRKRACDLERDKEGKIIIDLAHPHILENMDYFRQAALHYKKYGVYTNLKPNGNPNSSYGKYIREEIKRCLNGLIRPSDGEWITGQMYFFLNYSVMELTKNKEGSKQAYRKMDFPEVWEGIYFRSHYLYQARYGGKYNDFKGGNHAAELASRGKGKSYFLSSILSHNFIFGESYEASKNIVSVIVAYLKEYLSIKNGTLGKFLNTINFCSEFTQFPRRKLIDSVINMTWKMGYKDPELNIDKGTLNTVLGVTTNDDVAKIRGKRASFIGIEEFGTFPNLRHLYNIMQPSVQEGDYVFGLIYMIGTAGDKESDFAGAKEIMYNPKGYSMYSIPNVYDKDNSGKREFIYFFPGYLNRKGCYNENGVSDVVKAIIEILLKRYNIKYNSTDPNTLLREIAEIPITPSEAIIKFDANIFPTLDITERINQLDNNINEYNDVYIGDIVFNSNNQPEFKITQDTPIREFPHKNNKISGAIEIYNMPEKTNNNGKSEVYKNRYIASLDPVDDDSSETMSLVSIFVLDLWTDKIVCEWTGRLDFAEDAYEKVRKICLFYNAILNYENNKKGLFAYFSKMNCLHLLAPTLEFLKDKEMVTTYSSINNKSFGINATAPLNNFAIRLLRDWLIKPVETLEIIEDKEVITTKANLYTIRNRALLRELSLYNKEGNFDRVSSMLMLMLFREDRIVTLKGNMKNIETDSEYLGNDPFFNNNYVDKHKKKLQF